MKAAFDWLLANKEGIAATVISFIVLAETVVRLTPTKKDDGAVERVGAVIRKVLDFLKLPNLKK